jgi:hypothetical protein
LNEELEGVRGADGITPKLFLKRGERGPEDELSLEEDLDGVMEREWLNAWLSL